MPHTPALDISQLDRSEHLVLFGFRMLAVGHAECPMLFRVFGEHVGPSFGETLTSLLSLVRSVGWCGCRRVHLHVPGCAAVSEDERIIIAVVAAAQASLADGDEVELRSSLVELLGTAPQEVCLMAAQSVAAALTCSGLNLPRRLNSCAISGEGSSQTLH